MSSHGTSGHYTRQRCRCAECTDGVRRDVASCRSRRYKLRVMVDGRLTAPGPVEHGNAATYRNHGCRCLDCTAASTEAARQWRATRLAARRAAA